MTDPFENQLARYHRQFERDYASSRQAFLTEVTRQAGSAAAPKSQHRRSPRWRSLKVLLPIAVAACVLLALAPWANLRNSHGQSGAAWADVVKAFEAATSIHAVQIAHGDGQELRTEAWFRRPMHYRFESPMLSFIDDGKDRLTCDHKSRTAQWSDSLLANGSAETDWIPEFTTTFRRPLDPGYRKTRVDAECTQSETVYVITSDDQPESIAKVWIDTGTLLVRRLEGKQVLKDATGATKRTEMKFEFSYAPIPDSIFSLTVPPGYKSLPRPQRMSVTGHVVGGDGSPVAGATVYVVTAWGHLAREGRTDNAGQFTLQLPPKGAPNDRMSFPIVVRAFVPQDPTHVAWTVIRSPDDRDELSGTIPGDPGKPEIDRTIGQPTCTAVSGIVLKMEPATYLAGHVTDIDGLGLAGAEVRVEVALANRWGGTSTYLYLGGPPSAEGHAVAVTDEHGAFRLAHLPSFWKKSDLALRVSAPRHAARDRRLEIGGKWSRDAVDFQLFRAEWTVTGRVVDEQGARLTNRLVYALVDGESVPGCATQTDNQGTFRIERCPVTSKLQIKVELSHEYHGMGGNDRPPEPWFYLDVTRNVDVKPNQTQYHVEFVAQRPDLTLEILVRNSAGDPLPHFPLELRGNGIPHGWSWNQFQTRTDATGRCTLRQVPRDPKLRLRTWSGLQIMNEQLKPDVAPVADAHRQKYQRIFDIPVPITGGKSNYEVNVTVLTQEEWEAKKKQSTARAATEPR